MITIPTDTLELPANVFIAHINECLESLENAINAMGNDNDLELECSLPRVDPMPDEADDSIFKFERMAHLTSVNDSTNDELFRISDILIENCLANEWIKIESGTHEKHNSIVRLCKIRDMINARKRFFEKALRYQAQCEIIQGFNDERVHHQAAYHQIAKSIFRPSPKGEKK